MVTGGKVTREHRASRGDSLRNLDVSALFKSRLSLARAASAPHAQKMKMKGPSH